MNLTLLKKSDKINKLTKKFIHYNMFNHTSTYKYNLGESNRTPQEWRDLVKSEDAQRKVNYLAEKAGRKILTSEQQDEKERKESENAEFDRKEKAGMISKSSESLSETTRRILSKARGIALKSLEVKEVDPDSEERVYLERNNSIENQISYVLANKKEELKNKLRKLISGKVK